MKTKLSALFAGTIGALTIGGVAGSQGMPTPSHDFKAAPAGTYAVDTSHTGLVVRVPHMGFSYSVFRMTAVTGSLDWNPANPRADKLSVTVDPNSIETAPTSVDFGKEINEKFLKATQFPSATFVSTAFHPKTATHGTVEGDLTMIGVTKHVVFDVDLVGAGKGFRGPVIGVHATTEVNGKDFGLPGFISGPVELVIDSEFDGKAAS